MRIRKATADMLAEYASGKTVRQVATAFGTSSGQMYYLLRNAGCKFRKAGMPPGWHPSPEAIKRSAEKRRGMKRSDETRRRLSEVRKCSYNGLNGYGHTKLHPRGYVLTYAPLHPKAHKDGYVMLHTVIIEQNIGRYLYPDEVVHHKNHIRDDNRIENLELMKKNDHCSMHAKERNSKKGELLSTV